MPDVVASWGPLTSFRGTALALRVAGVGNWGTAGTDRRELRVRVGGDTLGGGGDALGEGTAAFLLFDARPEVPSLFLFPLRGRGGDRGCGGREFEEGGISFVDGVEAGMETLAITISLPVAGVGGKTGRGEGDKERREAGHDGAGEGGQEGAEIEGYEGASEA